jgi:predicted DNA-binding transcriptional regulator YafY
MRRCDRHDAIIRSLRRNGFLTISDLQNDVPVSRRTLLRDICDLREQGYVIEAESGRGGGLRLQPTSARGNARLATTEVFALILSLTAAKTDRLLPFARLADDGLAKIERSLSADCIKDLRRLLECVHVGQLSRQQDLTNMGAPDAAVLPCIEIAFLQQRHIRFAYRDQLGVESHREVEPQAILILPPLSYLVAWDPLRDDFRHFRMDRITDPLIMSDRPFRRRMVPFANDVCPYGDLPKD